MKRKEIDEINCYSEEVKDSRSASLCRQNAITSPQPSRKRHPLSYGSSKLSPTIDLSPYRGEGVRHAAFTLAEVLVTLSILGVVAAISIPNIIQNYQKRVTITKLQKAYSEVNQLATNIAINSGCYGQNIYCTSFMQSADYNKSFGFYNLEQSKIIAKLAGFNNAKVGNKYIYWNYLSCELSSSCTKFETTSTIVTPAHNQYSFIFGRNLYFVNPCEPTSSDNVYSAIQVVVITEPKKTRYTLGRNMFYLLIHDNFQVSPVSKTILGKYCPAGKGTEGTPSRINTLCSPNSSNGHEACYAKIIQDGWKMNY